MKMPIQTQKQAGFAISGLMVALVVVVGIVGYFAVTARIPVTSQSAFPTVTQFLVPLGNYKINPPDAGSPIPSMLRSPNPTPQGITGAYGRVTVSYSMGPTASTRPYVGVMIVKVRATGVEYTRFSTDAQGNYSVNLFPGTYYAVPNTDTWPWATDPRYARDIVVRDGSMTHADIILIANSAQ